MAIKVYNPLNIMDWYECTPLEYYASAKRGASPLLW